MARVHKRFIKKVPASGASPAFKLTLPHHVVNAHLQHLVEADFELAPSANAQQTWQGSIVPRRNKDRSEYTLQGWKLFAEAHKVKAGDQVSFELTNPHRMVIQIIKPLDAGAPPQVAALSLQDIFMTSSISTGQAEQSSPSGKQRDYTPQDQPEHLEGRQVDDNFFQLELDDPLDLDDWALPTTTAALPLTISEESSQFVGSDHQVEATLPPSEVAKRGVPSPDNHFLQPSLSSADFDMPIGSIPSLTSDPSRATSPSQSRKRSHSLSDVRATSFSSIFTDMLLEPLDTPNADPPAKKHVGVDGVSPVSTGPAQQPDATLDLQLGNLMANIHSLQKDVHQFESRAGSAEKEVGSLRSSYESLQRALDARTREALRAETGLEKAAARLASLRLLASVDSQTADSLLAIQADLSSFLGALKHSLWDLLVLGLGDTEGSRGLSARA